MSFLMKLQEEGLKQKSSLRKTTTIVTDKTGRRRDESSGTILSDGDGDGPGYVVDTTPDPGVYECFPNLYIGSQDAAMNLEGTSVSKKKANATAGGKEEKDVYFPGLLDIGITHVVNVFSKDRNFEDHGLVYLNTPLLDVPEQPLFCIDEALEFIHGALTAPNIAKKSPGKVLVHCNAGISRASTVIIAYLIKYHGMSYQMALAEVRKNRPAARPNAGFEAQLLDLEKQHHGDKHANEYN